MKVSDMRAQVTANSAEKGYIGMPMEGIVARWYAKIRGSSSQIADWKKQAAQLTAGLPAGADILEVAPGPGYFSLEMAKLGRFHVTGLDISHTFVEIARGNSRKAGLPVDFREGDASIMPFADQSFDFIICQAAFKNFSRPDAVLNEMYRVLRPGGTAVIQDMNRDTSSAAIREEVRHMEIGPWNAFMTRRSLGMLRRRAYSVKQFETLAQESAFGGARIETSGIGLEVRLSRESQKS
jgi:ubiquinone/menaquinone biosynthesis C-methylase UbiE